MKFRSLFFLTLILLNGCGSSISPERHDAIVKGGEWFLNDENEDFIYYQFDPASGEHPDSSHAMREMGALWSIYHLGDFLEDERYDALAQKGLDYFKATIAHDAENDFSYVNITPDSIKLGYNAFMILNLLESEDSDKDELMQELADGILYQQSKNGRFDTFFFSDQVTGKDYYPGEALLALMSLYEYTGEQRYLDSVTEALPYYQAYFKDTPNTAFVPWQTQAFVKYYDETQDQEVADFVFAMNDYMVSEFSTGESCEPSTASAGIVTGVYVEGMTQAYALAKTLGDSERADCYERFIHDGIQTVLDLQFPLQGLDLSIYSEDALKIAEGGFVGSAKDLTMQVDRNQHAVMALMRAYEVGL